MSAEGTIEGGSDELSKSKVENEGSKGDTVEVNGTTESSKVEKVSGGENVSSTETPPAKKRPDDYRFGKLIGEGSFSSVYLAKDLKSEIEFAIKVCSKQHIIKERKSDSIRREKEAMTILSSNRNPKVPFFVRLYATFQDPERLYFVMTFGRGGEILKYLQKLKTFDKELCRFYAGEIVLALAHLHRLDLVHRDLKLENILLDDFGHILITDFGSAKNLKEEKPKAPIIEKTEPSPLRVTRSNSFVGTAQYVSPEVLQGRYSEVGPPADLWALGCILFQFGTGTPPFNGATEYLVFQRIIAMDYKFPPDFDESTSDLIQKLLKPEPLDRIGAQDEERYTSIQNHSFFEGLSFDSLCEQKAPLSQTSSTASELFSKYHIPDTIQPGFDPRVMAARALQDEGVDLNDVKINMNIVNSNDKINEDIANRNSKVDLSIKISEPELIPDPIGKAQQKPKSCCACILA